MIGWRAIHQWTEGLKTHDHELGHTEVEERGPENHERASCSAAEHMSQQGHSGMSPDSISSIHPVG